MHAILLYVPFAQSLGCNAGRVLGRARDSKRPLVAHGVAERTRSEYWSSSLVRGGLLATICCRGYLSHMLLLGVRRADARQD